LRAEGSLEPPILVELQEENGLYTGSTPGLAKAGAWNVRLSVRRVQEFDAIHVFDVEIGPAPVAVTDWSKVSRILLLFGGPACAWAIWPRRPLTAGGGVRLAPAAAMAVLALVLLASPPRATADDPVNAVPATTASVARGAELYAEHCNLCHGPQGKGDGPIGVTLNPPPADLTLHTVPGVHTDGRLFLWIRDGFPNSPMPAFGETISEEDMWHLVNFIRTLPTAEP
jgi:mono/diheme cytochrome c family protein